MTPKIKSASEKAAFVSLLAALLYAVLIRPSSLLEIPKLKTEDLFFKTRYVLSGKPAVLNDFVLISIDDESIQRLSEKWPFRRKRYADILKILTDADPKLYGFDFIFSGKGDPLDDALLEQAVLDAKRVVLASFVDTAGNYLLSQPNLHRSARGSGVVNKLLDTDLSVRRVKLAYSDARGKAIAWPWEVEILRLFRRFHREDLFVNAKGVFLKDHERPDEIPPSLIAPAYSSGSAKVNFRFKEKDVAQIPFWKVFQDPNAAKSAKGKILLVGTTSQALHDYYHTPLGLMSGVLVNMNFLANLFEGDFLHPIPLWGSLAILALFAFFGAYLGFRFNVLFGVLAYALATAGLAAAFLILLIHNFLGDFFTPVLTGWIVFLGTTLNRYFETAVENIELRGKAVTDPLTGLFNRRALEAQLDAEFEKLAQAKGARRTDPYFELSVLMLDVDDFKKLNDTHGHPFGDDVLVNVAFSIRENIRTDDLAARYGGEEFCIVLPHTSKEQAARVAEKIRRHVQEKKFSYVNTIARVTVSIGAASAKADNLIATRPLIRGADVALYEAKNSGKNKVCLYKSGS